MLISSETGGGEIVSSEETSFYDDVACLAADWSLRLRSGQASAGKARAFVRVGRLWLDAHNASYAQPDGARTTMGSGVVAFVTIAEASSADRAGRALTFDDVIRLAGERR